MHYKVSSDRILRDLAIVLRSVGVQPRDPLVHDLAMALDVVSQLVRAAVSNAPDSSWSTLRPTACLSIKLERASGKKPAKYSS